MFRIGKVGLAGLVVLLGCVLAESAVAATPRVERNVGYSDVQPGEFDRSYDLYSAEAPGGALVLFVHSRFWNERQPDALIEQGFVRGLLDAGHSVAVLRHRLGAGGRHPAAIEDVARGVGDLLGRVEAGEFDADRVFLAGHSSGAQLALLVALDPQWLAREGRETSSIAGVVSLSGIVDLDESALETEEEKRHYRDAFPDAETRSRASPIELVNPDVPAILLLTAAQDIPGYLSASLRYSKTARAAGQPAIEALLANGRNHYSILDLSKPGGVHHVFDLLESRPREGNLPEMWQITSTWRDPPLSTADFHTRYGALIREYEADAYFIEVANRPFMTKSGAPIRLRTQRYKAIDLLTLLEKMGEERIGKGDWLEIRNARGEKAFFSMERLRALKPRLVVGLGEEPNLFKATDLYHTRRRYSWVDAEASRVDMARPIGAFLFFPEQEPPHSESSRLIGRYALTSESFRLSERNPLAAFEDLPPIVREALISEHACISCHRFRDVGGRAFHIRARDAKAMGGHALPLERYPAVVWKRFVFEQEQVAEEVGATAVEFSPASAKALFDFVVEERTRRGIKPWTHPARDRDASSADAAPAGWPR